MEPLRLFIFPCRWSDRATCWPHSGPSSTQTGTRHLRAYQMKAKGVYSHLHVVHDRGAVRRHNPNVGVPVPEQPPRSHEAAAVSGPHPWSSSGDTWALGPTSLYCCRHNLTGQRCLRAPVDWHTSSCMHRMDTRTILFPS